MIRCLAREFDVCVVSFGTIDLPGVQCERIAEPRPRTLLERVQNAARVFRGRYRDAIWTHGLRALASRHRLRRHSLIVVHDLRLLPVALSIRGRTGRVLFDAREYYPRHYEDLYWWRWLYQPMNVNLCRRYLRRADAIVTVSRGLATEYRREFGVHCTVLPSMSAPRDLTPQPVIPDRIRLVHHGLASPSRQLEGMIRMMDGLPSQFTLDLILVPRGEVYMKKLRALSASRPRVRILPPLPFTELVTATNEYDIGVFLVPPVNFNLKFVLPNKFFEFVQARLMIAIGPSPEMAWYVREHRLGVVAENFQPATLAAALNRVTASEIQQYKENAHRAAALLNSDRTDAQVRKLTRGAAQTAGDPLPSWWADKPGD